MKNNTKFLIIALIIAILSMVGCSSGTSTESKSKDSTVNSSDSSSTKPAETKATKAKLTAQLILDKLKETESANITKINIVTAENDENKFLGRPNQYTEKINWNDSRLKDSQTESSIELFNNNEDAAARKTYLESVIKSFPMFTQYIVQKDNVLLRIEGGLTPDQSDEYIKVFKSIQ